MTYSNSTVSAHTSQNGVSIFKIPTVDEPSNKFNSQICITVDGDLKERPTASTPFDTHTTTAVEVSISLENDVVNVIKNK